MTANRCIDAHQEFAECVRHREGPFVGPVPVEIACYSKRKFPCPRAQQVDDGAQVILFTHGEIKIVGNRSRIDYAVKIPHLFVFRTMKSIRVEIANRVRVGCVVL